MVTPKNVRVMVVISEPVTRYGLVSLINSQSELQVCSEAGEAPVARELFLKTQPDVVLVELELRRGDGLDLIKDFRKLNPGPRPLVITTDSDPDTVQRAFRAGASGYVVRDEETHEIVEAIRRVAAGELFASKLVSRTLLNRLATGTFNTQAGKDGGLLSARELQVMKLIGRNYGPQRVAHELGLSVKTIESHRQRIKVKLNLNTAAELNEYAGDWVREEHQRIMRNRGA